ncbi:hypothetical protein OH77DRAFT_1421245 [Trametes cingulata]|nr:hypothetical protein OH77DRAFT_1421245 [Trametes cingulata]
MGLSSNPSHALLALPDEILLQIIHHLDLQDIIALRKTCRRLRDPTQDRSVWLHILRHQGHHLPLPYHITDPSAWTHIPSEQLETIIRRLFTIDRTWLSPRTHYFVPGHRQSCALDPIFDNDDGARSIYSLEIFLERWLLCIYHEKLVEIWDLDSVLHDPNKPLLCTSQNIKGNGSFSSAITHLDEATNLLTVAVSCHELCEVLQVQLRPSSTLLPVDDSEDLDDIHFRCIADVPIPSPILCLRAVDPSRSLLLLSLPSSFHLLNWATGQRTTVHMLHEEEEELWNGVVVATFLTSRHILVLKAHSIELCTLIDSDRPSHTHPPPSNPDPDALSSSPTHPSSSSTTISSRPQQTHMCAVVHSHYHPSATFRGASFARPVVHRPSPHLGAASREHEPTKVSTSFLAFDVLRGLFHYSVEVILPPSISPPDSPVSDAYTHPAPPPPIDVHIQLLSTHNMALPVPLPPATFADAAPPLHPTPTSAPALAEHAGAGTGAGTGTFPRSGFGHGTRGFVSACALGPAGRRGVWVERRRGAVRRVVYGFDAVGRIGVGDEDADESLREEVEGSDAEEIETEPMGVDVMNGGLSGRAGAIEGKEVYEVNSYDLRDDITHIAFAEATGLIAVGTRKGEIRVLGRAGVY